MFVGHNFDSEPGHAISLAKRGEAEGDFWTRLLRILESAHLAPDECFFTNVLMGLKPGKAEGAMPSVPGYREQCRQFLARQVKIVRPRAIVALGSESANYVAELNCSTLPLLHPGAWCFRGLETRNVRLAEEGQKLREFLGAPESSVAATLQPSTVITQTNGSIESTAENLNMTGKSLRSFHAGTDQWGFRIGTRNAFLMHAIEAGGKSKEEIRLEFLEQFPESAGKSTFNVFFTDLIRPFGSASVSRCVRIETGEGGRFRLDPERAAQVKAAVEAGILDGINALEGSFPKKNLRAIDEIIERYRAPRK
jgi:uracil-DNA glycosylase